MSRSILRAGAALGLSVVLSAIVSTAPPGYAALVDASGRTAPARSSSASGPPDRNVYQRSAPAPRRAAPALPAGVFVTDPSLSASSFGGGEPSIAVNPANPNQIAITRFTFLWNSNADLLYSTNGGSTWTEEATIPAPPGVSGTGGCPCDQTIDYGRDGRLYGTFLTGTPHVVTGSTTDPTSAAAWRWNGSPAQLTEAAGTSPDQPQLLVNRDPGTAGQDDAYVAYDDFNAGPTAHVAVSRGANPVNITVDSPAGSEAFGAANPGLRLASDHGSGTMYAMFQQSSGASPQTITYKLNRSTDGGATWTLNGSADGLTVDTVSSDQAPGFKFGTVNALLGGVDHVAVDPTNGDVYTVYGQDVSGGNQIRIRRLRANGSGGLTVGPAVNVATSTNAALPSVAVASDGTIGVLYDTFDGMVSGLPAFSAHLARSVDHGTTFSDATLESFSSPEADNGDGRQRVLGDYQQLKAVGATFYGVFSGNRNVFGGTTSIIDPIFVSAAPNTGATTTTTVSALANPANLGQNASFTATVRPVPDGGSVSFTVDGLPLGPPVPVSPGSGTATSPSVSSLLPGSHSVAASYSGDANFRSSSGTLTQVVSCPSTVTGQVNTPLVIGRPTCITGATINSDVTIQPGVPVAMTSSTVNASFTARQAAEVLLCGDTFNDGLNVSATSGYVLVGDGGDDGAVGCAPNTLHSVMLTSNAGGVELAGNTVNGDITVNGTTGAGSPLEGAPTEIEGNHIQGTLNCSGNNPAPTNDGQSNSVSGSRSGQCASSQF
jgi:hypothetical protein